MFSIFDFISIQFLFYVYSISTQSMSSVRADWISVNSGLNNVKYFSNSNSDFKKKKVINLSS